MVLRTTLGVDVTVSGTARTPVTGSKPLSGSGYVVACNVVMLNTTANKKGDNWVSVFLTFSQTGVSNDYFCFTSGYNYAGNANSWTGRIPYNPGDVLVVNCVSNNIVGQAKANFIIEPDPRGIVGVLTT